MMNKSLNAARFLDEKLLSLDPKKGKVAQMKVQKLFKDMVKDSTTGEKANFLINETIDQLKKIDPKFNISDDFNKTLQQVRNVAENINTHKEMMGDSPWLMGGSLTGQTVRSAYLLGRAKEYIKNKTNQTKSEVAEELLGKKIANTTAEASRVTREFAKQNIGTPINKQVSKIKDLSDSMLEALASRATSLKMNNVSNFLKNLKEIKGKRRDAVIFSAMQNPSLRQGIIDLVQDEDN